MRCDKCSMHFEDKDDILEKRAKAFQTVPWFDYPKSDKFARTYREFRDGKYENFDNVQSDVEVYKFYTFKDPYDGEVTVARVNIMEMLWIRGKWAWLRAILRFFPGCVKRRRYIDVEFRDEVGPKKGSWKGGLMGTSFNMEPDETIEECFTRFILEYDFR